MADGEQDDRKGRETLHDIAIRRGGGWGTGGMGLGVVCSVGMVCVLFTWSALQYTRLLTHS